MNVSIAVKKFANSHSVEESDVYSALDYLIKTKTTPRKAIKLLNAVKGLILPNKEKIDISIGQFDLSLDDTHRKIVNRKLRILKLLPKDLTLHDPADETLPGLPTQDEYANRLKSAIDV